MIFEIDGVSMPIHERRQHFRIEDRLYFNFRILEAGESLSDRAVLDELLGNSGQKYIETSQYFQDLDYELTELTQAIAMKEPVIAHYLNLLNSKIDYMVRQMIMDQTIKMRKVNISLGGMAFKANNHIKEKTELKMLIYTKPKMIPLILDATVVYSQFQGEMTYRTAVTFKNLTQEQEQLLSQHILMCQMKNTSD